MRDSSGAVIQAGDVGQGNLRVGDCLDEREDATAPDVPVVPCDQPHDREIFAIVDLEGDEFPGDSGFGLLGFG